MPIIYKRRPEASQRFPFIPLARAIERGRELYKVAANHEVPIATAMKAWTYSEKSSGGLQTAAALKAFGLLEDVGTGEVRQVKLTDAALRIIRDPRDISPDRDGLIRQAALTPPLHREIIDKYGGMPPSDEALKAFLLIDRSMKDEAVPEFIREFTATMAFAKLAESGTIQDIDRTLDAASTENFADDIVRARNEGLANRASQTASQRKVPMMEGERVVFTEEGQPNQYLKLVASGDLDAGMLEALVDFVKRQRKRLGLPPLPPAAYGAVVESTLLTGPEEEK